MNQIKEAKIETLGSGVLGPSCSELDVGPLRFPSRCHNINKKQH